LFVLLQLIFPTGWSQFFWLFRAKIPNEWYPKFLLLDPLTLAPYWWLLNELLCDRCRAGKNL